MWKLYRLRKWVYIRLVDSSPLTTSLLHTGFSPPKLPPWNPTLPPRGSQIASLGVHFYRSVSLRKVGCTVAVKSPKRAKANHWSVCILRNQHYWDQQFVASYNFWIHFHSNLGLRRAYANKQYPFICWNRYEKTLTVWSGTLSLASVTQTHKKHETKR